jgi:hypothetical protein
MNSLKKIIGNPRLYGLIPPFVKQLGRKWLKAYKFDHAIWASQNEFVGTEYEWAGDFGSEQEIGILWDFAHSHVHFMRACHEEKISYRVIDYTRSNWQERIKESGLDHFLVWPSVYNSVWKNMCDSRLRILKEEMLKTVFPTEKETWLYESKLRIADWLNANGFPMPHSEVFYHEDEAINALDSFSLPIVVKTDQGASASGVFICRSRNKALSLIRKAFSSGIKAKRGDQRDTQWGYIMLQEYIEDAEEWRMVKIGSDYFCRLKGKVGDFHSGSGLMSWAKADNELFELFRSICEKTGFDSINIDFFKDPAGNYFINEFHTVFGAILKKNLNWNDPKMGRYKFRDGEWHFENGYFYDNACANLRLKYLLNQMQDGRN